MNVSRCLLKIPVVLIAFTVFVTGASANVKLASHRAVYDLTFIESDQNSSVIDVRGRIVFEIIGSSCEGYTVNMRILTDLSYKGGKSSLTDTTMLNWEDFDGKSFVFETSSRTNNRSTEENRGRAQRNDDGTITVKLVKPAKKTINLGNNTAFPSEHLRVMIEAARDKQRIVERKLYDGSEDGASPFDTSAYIGDRITPVDITGKADVTDRQRLEAIESWPVTLSYFKKDQLGEAVPDYEVNFRLYANGVSTNLVFDYGDFIMGGPLREIKLLKETSCE